MTIKQHGGVFGRNPSFNDVSVESLSIAGTALSSTAAELNILDGVTADSTEINYLDGASTSVVTASKAVLANASANIPFASGNGIDFSATGDGSGTASSELFNDYEKGEWTPEFRPGTGSFGSITYDPEVGGRYVKIGSLVHAFFRIRTDALTVGTASGSLSIEGLPYTVVNEPTTFHLGATSFGVISGFAGENPTHANPLRNSDIALLYYKTAADGDIAQSNVSDLGTGANANLLGGVIIYRTS